MTGRHRYPPINTNSIRTVHRDSRVSSDGYSLPNPRNPSTPSSALSEPMSAHKRPGEPVSEGNSPRAEKRHRPRSEVGRASQHATPFSPPASSRKSSTSGSPIVNTNTQQNNNHGQPPPATAQPNSSEPNVDPRSPAVSFPGNVESQLTSAEALFRMPRFIRTNTDTSTHDFSPTANASQSKTPHVAPYSFEVMQKLRARKLAMSKNGNGSTSDDITRQLNEMVNEMRIGLEQKMKDEMRIKLRQMKDEMRIELKQMKDEMRIELKQELKDEGRINLKQMKEEIGRSSHQHLSKQEGITRKVREIEDQLRDLRVEKEVERTKHSEEMKTLRTTIANCSQMIESVTDSQKKNNQSPLDGVRSLESWKDSQYKVYAKDGHASQTTKEGMIDAVRHEIEPQMIRFSKEELGHIKAQLSEHIEQYKKDQTAVNTTTSEIQRRILEQEHVSSKLDSTLEKRCGTLETNMGQVTDRLKDDLTQLNDALTKAEEDLHSVRNNMKIVQDELPNHFDRFQSPLEAKFKRDIEYVERRINKLESEKRFPQSPAQASSLSLTEFQQKQLKATIMRELNGVMATDEDLRKEMENRIMADNAMDDRICSIEVLREQIQKNSAENSHINQSIQRLDEKIEAGALAGANVQHSHRQIRDAHDQIKKLEEAMEVFRFSLTSLENQYDNVSTQHLVHQMQVWMKPTVDNLNNLTQQFNLSSQKIKQLDDFLLQHGQGLLPYMSGKTREIELLINNAISLMNCTREVGKVQQLEQSLQNLQISLEGAETNIEQERKDRESAIKSLNNAWKVTLQEREDRQNRAVLELKERVDDHQHQVNTIQKDFIEGNKTLFIEWPAWLYAIIELQKVVGDLNANFPPNKQLRIKWGNDIAAFARSVEN